MAKTSGEIQTIKQLASDIAGFIRDYIDKAKFTKHYNATILSKSGHTYKIQIFHNKKEYTATSYFDLPVGKKVYAVAPNNDFNKLYLMPFE